MSLFFTPPFQIEAMDERTTRSSTHKGAEALAEAVAEVFPLTCPSVSPPSGPPPPVYSHICSLVFVVCPSVIPFFSMIITASHFPSSLNRSHNFGHVFLMQGCI